MKLWICDDDGEMLQVLGAMCHAYLTEQNIQAEVFTLSRFPAELDDLAALQRAAGEGKLPDILLLDIDMPGRSGLEIKDALAELEKGPYIIFVTSHRETIEEAFGRNVIGFLTKPVDSGRLKVLMDRTMVHHQKSRKQIMIDGRKLYCEDIRYMETSGIYTKVFLKDEKWFEVRKSLKEWESMLPAEDFFRINERQIVGFAWAAQVEGDQLTMETGEIFTISRRKKKQCREAFVGYAARTVRYR